MPGTAYEFTEWEWSPLSPCLVLLHNVPVTQWEVGRNSQRQHRPPEDCPRFQLELWGLGREEHLGISTHRWHRNNFSQGPHRNNDWTLYSRKFSANHGTAFRSHFPFAPPKETQASHRASISSYLWTRYLSSTVSNTSLSTTKATESSEKGRTLESPSLGLHVLQAQGPWASQ